jgi:hypothetical protein
MKLFKKSAVALAMAAAMMAAAPILVSATEEIPRAPSTPNTPKNWVGPGKRILAQQLVDETFAKHPELASITIHAIPPGLSAYSMIAGTFPDRIGNESSPGDIITAKKGVTQVESKWGTENWGHKVSIVAPLKNTKGEYLPAAIIMAFKTTPDSKKIDTDFMAPGVAIRDSLNSRIASVESLFDAVK